ncbi:hypothetical protein LIER_22813 [Lithospermum erythrorhizon]|uniref:KOW domain-containing protein n=1 Tax=Lithospermum erythrorhizon TaxID=34254 RepID=A0AAV3QV58_LITER
MASLKGKEKVAESNFGKRKRNSDDQDKSGGGKRRNSGVLQFFEDSAYEVDVDSSDDDQDDFDVSDFLEDEFVNDVKANNNELGIVPFLNFIKDEEMDDAELERMVEELYGRGSSIVRYAEDGYDNREADRDEYPPLFRDPTLWKVKCMVGREKYSVFCLMQKYVDLQPLGTKLQIISAFSLDRVKGFVYIEADSQQVLYEACKGLTTIYLSRVAPVPPNERSHLLSVRSKGCGISAGMWARVKSGKYKGDLGQIVAVNEARKKATVKLIPRIDLRALAEKFGGGVSVKRTSTPTPPRLISSREIEEFGPLVQIRRDRDTNTTFEVLDGMMLKDGYLYKKIPIDSLSVWGAMPTEVELLKFEPTNNNDSMDLEFLSDLYGTGNRKKKEKGEGSSTCKVEYSFKVHDLVFFGKKDFGVIIGMEKDDNFKIMKEGTEGPLVLTLPARDLKISSFDKKLFTAQDLHLNTISIDDRVKVMDGPLKDKEGVVRHIYRGIIFLFNENEEEHNGYTCFKSQICEEVISAGQASNKQFNEPRQSGFGESPPSPSSTLSPKKSWPGRENSSFNQKNKNAMFSVGQSLRIKVGPLKGYLCRVLAIRRSDVTVMLDSQHKTLTVESEHLSEVRGKSLESMTGGNQESAKPFDTLGATDGSRESQYKKDENRSLGNQGANSGKTHDGGSSWNKDGGSSWSKLTRPSWGQQADAKVAEVHDRTESNQTWGNQAGSSWNKQDSGLAWHRPTDQNQTWGKKGGGSWNKQDGGSSWGKPAGGSSWGQQASANAKPINVESINSEEEGNNCNAAKKLDWRSSGWEMKPKPFNKSPSSGWGNSSSWNQNNAGNSEDLEGRNQSDSWEIKKASARGSSTGLGKVNWGKSSTDDAPGNHNSAWTSKRDWGAGNDYSERQEQVENFGGGRGRSWRGGWGGRGEPDRGKGDSGRGGFRGRGGSSGPFGGRDGSDQGGYDSRGRSGRGGFRGRGRLDFGGRGQSDRGRGGSGRGGFRGRGGSFGGREGPDQGGSGGSGHGGFRGRGGSFGGRNGPDQGGRGRGSSGRGGFRGGGGSFGGRNGYDQGGRGGSGRGGFSGRGGSFGGRDGSDQGGRDSHSLTDEVYQSLTTYDPRRKNVSLLSQLICLEINGLQAVLCVTLEL